MASRARLASVTPRTSNRCRRPGWKPGMMKNVTDRTAIPIGRLTKKIQRQSKAVTSRPPRVGPGIVARAATAAPSPDPPPPPFRRERHRDDGQRLRHQHGRAQALDRAKADQPADPGREPAG